MSTAAFNYWVDKSIYNLKTLQKVCYVLARDYSFELALCDEGYQIKATSYKATTEQEFRGKFGHLLLDYALREHIAEETGELKAEILRTALSSVAKRS